MKKQQTKLNHDTRVIIVALILIAIGVTLYYYIKPWIAEYYYRQGYIANTYRHYSDSQRYLDLAYKYAPWETYYQITQVKNYEALANEAKTLEEKMSYLKKAQDLYKYMLKINPTNPWYLNGLASIDLALFNLSQDPAARKEYMDEAGEAYEKAANIDQKNPLFQMSLAYFKHRSGQIEEAVKLYKRCVELDDWFVEAYFNLGEISLGQGNIDQAIGYFEEMARADRENYDENSKRYSKWVKGGNFRNYRTRLAELYLSKKNYKKAIEYFNWALEKEKDNPKIWRGLGIAYHQSNQLERAIYSYKQAITYDPDLYDVYKYLGYAYYNVGLLNSAVENLSRYLRHSQGDQKAKNDLAKMKRLLRQYR